MSVRISAARSKTARRVAFACLLGLALVVPANTHALAQQPIVLLTAEEAALPPVNDIGARSRGLTRGPAIEAISPDQDKGEFLTPAPVRIRFVPRNGVPINPDTVPMTYLRSRAIDVTFRVKSFISANGVDIPLAAIPPGAHAFRLELADGMG